MPENNNSKKRVLLATGIYPPEIGGPAQYAKNLEEALRKKGIAVAVKTFRIEKKLPTGLRHAVFFLKIFPALLRADFSIALDTFSVALPTVLAAKILGKKAIIRTGGDFLWEGYVERTGKSVLLKDFYSTKKGSFSLKEKIIYSLTRWTLKNAAYIAFSTKWQQDLFVEHYGIPLSKTGIIENFYGEKVPSEAPAQKNFLGFTRKLKWKNLATLEKAFQEAKKEMPDLALDMEPVSYEDSLEKMKKAYAVILVSLGDISPNMILDALRANRPFICTRETGLYEKLSAVGIFVDPQNVGEIREKILWLSKPENYDAERRKISGFLFTHSWDEIAEEFLRIYDKVESIS